MFYSHSILAKSGPFAHVWLAATWEKKVTRSMIFGTDIATVVESIANPAAPLAVLILGDGMSGKTHALRAVEVHTHSTTFGM